MEIRDYQIGDAGVLCTLMAQLGYPMNEADLSRNLRSCSTNTDSRTLVAIVDDKAVGMISMSSYHVLTQPGKVAHIQAFVVDESFRQMGIGSRLFEAAEEIALSIGAQLLYLTSGIKDSRAASHNFYKRRGLEITGYRFVKVLP